MTKTPKWQPDGSGIDPESLDVGTVVEWDGQVSRPPSQAVIEAVERAEREHLSRWFMAGRFECICGAPMKDGTAEAHDAHRRFEIARAAEAAALKVAADECEANARDWYGTDIFRDVDSADLAAKIAARDARRDAQTRADECERIAHLMSDGDGAFDRYLAERLNEPGVMRGFLLGLAGEHRERVQG